MSEARKLKRSDFRNAMDRINALPAERRAKIEAGASKIIADMHLSELRKAMRVTQATLAERSGINQADVSRLEREPEAALIKTIARYVAGLGGELKLVALFPDGTRAEFGTRHGKPVRSKLKVEAAPTQARHDAGDMGESAVA